MEKVEEAPASDLGQSHASPRGPRGTALAKTTSATSAAVHRVTSRLTTRTITNPGPPPDGGVWAWLQVFCAWLAVFNTWGFVNSFGAFQTYYASILPKTNSTISWIGSVQACLLFLMGTFSGRAFDAGLLRPTVILGVGLQLVGMFTMSLAKNYWQLILTHGICTGVGGGIFFVPIMGLVATYFAKNRAIAIGIVTTANSAGGTVYPLVIRQMIPTVGFGWTVRVLAFINVASLAVVIGLARPRLPPRKSGPLIDYDAFTDVPYMLHILGMCFIMPHVYFVFYYIASFARDTLSMPYAQSLNMVLILNGVGIPARILPGFVADRYLGVLNTYCLLLSIIVIIIWTWLGVNSIASCYSWTIIYGLFSAAFQSLFPTTLAAYTSDISKTGTRIGMAFTAIGFSALVAGPLGGALLSASHRSYTGPICWASASTLIGVALCMTAKCVKFGWSVRVRC